MTLRIGIIGGGLMGREAAACFGRWFALENFPVQAELVAMCDLREELLDWFSRVPTVELRTQNHHELLAREDVDAVYVAVPHHLHEAIYCDVLAAGKDLLAEKPFGIDLAAARRIADAVKASDRFVRCSSEFPFAPGAQRAFQYVQSGALGRVLEVRAGFLHSSDLDPTKAANWKRQSATCGEIGVMGDLGLHTVHIPFRLGWKPQRVFAQLQKGYPERPDGQGGQSTCDTWDNATLNCDVEIDGDLVPLRLEQKRMAPGQTNSWYFEALGTEGGVRFNTAEANSISLFDYQNGQSWNRLNLGHAMTFPVITGGIFEAGFPDYNLQMWAAFAAERAGALGDRFGCAMVEEAVASHELWQAALQSNAEHKVVTL